MEWRSIARGGGEARADTDEHLPSLRKERNRLLDGQRRFAREGHANNDNLRAIV